MMEKGSRKTAPPDTARVKVQRYILQMESNNVVNAAVQRIFTLNKNQIAVHLFILPISAPVLPFQTCATCVCDSSDWTQGTDHLLSRPHFTTSLKDLIN